MGAFHVSWDLNMISINASIKGLTRVVLVPFLTHPLNSVAGLDFDFRSTLNL